MKIKIPSIIIASILLLSLVPALFGMAAQSRDTKDIVFHTNSSDGTLTQIEVFEQLAAAGIGVNDDFTAAFDADVKVIGASAFAYRANLIGLDIWRQYYFHW